MSFYKIKNIFAVLVVTRSLDMSTILKQFESATVGVDVFYNPTA